jgi:glycosyltransferase involved in cell wall biosynthesis
VSRICIDGFNLAMPQGSGIATYARNLLAGIAAAPHETQLLLSSARPLIDDAMANQLALFDDRPQGRVGRTLTALRRLIPRRSVEASHVPLTGEVVAPRLHDRFPCADKIWAAHDVFHSANAAFAATRRFTSLRLGVQPGADVMHWTCPLPLAEPRVANVYTLHDLIPLRLPYLTLDDKRAYLAMCRTIAARADRIFTVSERSRRDIVDLLGADEARVVNTYQAVSLPERWLLRTERDTTDELAGVFGLEPQGYFLFFGAQEPKKNLRRIVEAFLASGVARPLVIVGAPWLSPSQRRRFGRAVIEGALPPERLMQDPRIRRLEYLRPDALRTLIGGARATLFPSLYEGFGLPVLESMLLGAPVITSTEGSLPEVAGEAALLVDPYDVDAIRDAIRALDADGDMRAELSARGRAQAAKFSPERYRERLRDAYAAVL